MFREEHDYHIFSVAFISIEFHDSSKERNYHVLSLVFYSPRII